MASLLLETDEGRPGFFRELAAAVISPPTGFNRLVFGNRFDAVFPSNQPATFTAPTGWRDADIEQPKRRFKRDRARRGGDLRSPTASRENRITVMRVHLTISTFMRPQSPPMLSRA